MMFLCLCFSLRPRAVIQLLLYCGIKLRVEYEAGACEDARVNARIRELVELNVLKRTA